MLHQEDEQIDDQIHQNSHRNQQLHEEQHEDDHVNHIPIQGAQKSQHYEQIKTERKKYGKMLVLMDGKCVITLGPDYWCFLPTFIIFCIISFLMIRFVLMYSQNFYFQTATIAICGGMCLAYFMVATSNPGMVIEQDLTDSQQQQNPMSHQAINRKRLCRKCNIRVRRGTYHCPDCDVCIRDYDHHCPWTSKCIGGGNLVRFYIFLTMIPIYLVYVFVAFATLMSSIALESATNHLKTAASRHG